MESAHFFKHLTNSQCLGTTKKKPVKQVALKFDLENTTYLENEINAYVRLKDGKQLTNPSSIEY